MLLIFDWDGTLLDSTGKIIRCMHMAVDEVSLPVRTDAQIRHIIGLGLNEAIMQLFGQLESQQIERLKKAYSKHFAVADQVPCDFFPGVKESLLMLRAEGYRLAVATGKSRNGLDRVLNNLQLSDFFDVTRCADESRSKPDPLMLHQILAHQQVSATDALMVGDTQFDLDMAKNAGIASVAVSYGAHEKQHLIQSSPLHIIDHFSELVDWLPIYQT